MDFDVGKLVILCFCIHFCQGISTPFIIGGNEARPPGKYGWQGLLTVDGYFRCGAILVTSNAALTSAACVQNLDTSRATITLGMHDKDSLIEGDPETYNVLNLQVYPDYDGSIGYPGNIAILQIDGDVNLDNAYISTIAVPESGRIPSDWFGLDCYATGWGRTSGSSSSTPNFLQEVMLPVVSSENCTAVWTAAGYPDTIIGSGNVCAFSELGTTCGGDDGGPFVCEQADGSVELVGMTSWRDSDCSPSYPSVFTMLSFYSEWIIDKLPTP